MRTLIEFWIAILTVATFIVVINNRKHEVEAAWTEGYLCSDMVKHMIDSGQDSELRGRWTEIKRENYPMCRYE